ncbi:MAG: hypothetical protein COA43_14665 [Robiginitomaculum sp.]|nr:MAG: hypothetical protein COA43_14665 [Robiginitomaculum sp.]
MNNLVKITENYDGEVNESYQRWCAYAEFDTTRTLCGETLDDASHFVAIFKEVKKGGITCERCIDIVKEIKQYKL